jgi:branched-chain amino acid transport system permease protein
MEQLLAQVAAGLGNGAIYAVLALALVMIFASTGHINFAQGELAMFSAFLCWQLIEWSLPFWLALPAVVLVSFALGMAIERVVLRPLAGAPVLSIVVVLIALLMIFHALAGGIWGHAIKAFPSPFPAVGFLGSSLLGSHQIGMVVVTVGLLAAIFAFFRFTPLGLVMRAAAQNPVSARLAGIRVDRMLALGWGLAAALGTVAGTLVAPVVYLEPGMMSGVLLYSFAGALLGGIASPLGAVAGGFMVGAIEALVVWLGDLFEQATGVYLMGSSEKLSVALAIVIAVLTLKPGGLLGRPPVTRI